MPTTYSLKIGGSNAQFRRSDTQIAVRAHVGMGRSMDSELRSLATRAQVGRRGRLRGYELIDIQASPAELSAARARLRSAASVRQEVPVYHTSDDDVPFVPVGTIYLSFKPGIADATKQRILENYRLELVASEPDDFLTVRLSGSETDAVDVSARLQNEPEVAVAEPDLLTTRRSQAFALPEDALLAQQWHLENTGTHNGTSLGFKQGADARVIAAWKLLAGLGSSDVVVGVIDDGFDLNHPDLADKAVDPWDFERNSSDVHPEPDLGSPDQGNWHGTACAGVAVGKAQGGKIVGAAPNAKLLPVRMNGDLSPVEVVRWFDHMTTHGAWVVSCSWAAEAAVYPLGQRIADAISRCAREGRGGKGCVVVFAAGNAGRNVNDPPNAQNGFAIHPDVIAVAASTSRDTHSDRSSFGREIWICAPSGGLGAWNITTSDVGGTYIDAAGIERSSGYAPGDYNFNFSGTSSSCPLVAGVCALVLGANPALTAREVRDLLKLTARKIGPPEEYRDGHSIKFGYGCVDAEGAVREALRGMSGDAPVAAAPATGIPA